MGLRNNTYEVNMSILVYGKSGKNFTILLYKIENSYYILVEDVVSMIYSHPIVDFKIAKHMFKEMCIIMEVF
jgi:hypothetical protein